MSKMGLPLLLTFLNCLDEHCYSFVEWWFGIRQNAQTQTLESVEASSGTVSDCSHSAPGVTTVFFQDYGNWYAR